MDPDPWHSGATTRPRRSATLPARGRRLDLQGIRRSRHLSRPDGRGARLPHRAGLCAGALGPAGHPGRGPPRGSRARHAPDRSRDGRAVRPRHRRRGRRRARHRDGRHRDALLDRGLARARRRAHVHGFAQSQGLHGREARQARGARAVGRLGHRRAARDRGRRRARRARNGDRAGRAGGRRGRAFERPHSATSTLRRSRR